MIKFLHSLAVKLILWLKSDKTIYNGKIYVSKVMHEGKIFSCTNEYESRLITVKEIPDFIKLLAKNSFNPKFIKRISKKQSEN